MSSSDDSETAEWEREQMLRGTQSRNRVQSTRHTQQETKRSKTSAEGENPESTSVIDASFVKDYIKLDIDKAEANLHALKKKMGATRLEMVKSDKKLDAIKRHISLLEESTPIFTELSGLSSHEQVTEFLIKYEHVISKLPPDQREMLMSLEKRSEASELVMDVD